MKRICASSWTIAKNQFCVSLLVHKPRVLEKILSRIQGAGVKITNNNRLRPSGHYRYHQVEHKKSHFVHGVHLCVWYGSKNKQRLSLHTALIDWF